jgi:hypothetical protein
LGTPDWKDDRCFSIALEQGSAESSDRIDCIDFLGLYEDFDHNGDGQYREWHYRFRYGRLMDHLATVDDIPYQATIDTSWIPEQSEPIGIMARITDYEGISRVSSIEELPWRRSRETCRLYTPRDVPACWQSRDGQRHSCTVAIPDNLDRATAARMLVSTWNGYGAEEIGVNGEKLLPRIGRNHDFALSRAEIPLSVLRTGENMIYTHGTTPHHGIEVLWPGPVIKVRYTT